MLVSAIDPDCGVNAMVNYTMGDGFATLKEFEVRSGTGEICISSALDYETRNVYEFPVVATDRGGLSTTAMVKIQVSDVNDNHPAFYPREYNVSLREGAAASASIPVVIVAATDPDSGRYGSLEYKIVAGNDANLFRIDRNSGEIFVTRPGHLSSRSSPYHRLNISATDGGGLKSSADAEVFISVIDSAQKPPIFQHARYTFRVKEDAMKNTFVGSVQAALGNSGDHYSVRYSIYSGDPDGYFRIDPISGTIRTAATLDHEHRASILLNIQANSGDPPVYGHTQVNIEIEDVNDNTPEFESNMVRISVPENVEIGTTLYEAQARDKDSGKNGIVRYKIVGMSGGLFEIDPKSGHLKLSRRLDYETTRCHKLTITASDTGVPSLSANLSVTVEVQDVNDNAPVFERTEYEAKVPETLSINAQILQVTAVDNDIGNNARLTYRLQNTSNSSVFGIFPNSGWLYLRGTLDRESKDRYDLTVVATDNGTPTESATTKVTISVLDANDNDPEFELEYYEFGVEENLPRGAYVGTVKATDKDMGNNATVRYFLIPGNTSFQMNTISGEITTKDFLDREQKEYYDLIIEAKDMGVPVRNSRISLKIRVLDVNDNAPDIVDPQEDDVSVREAQPQGTEVVRVKAIDADKGYNSTITYKLLNNRDSDGVFTIDPTTGVIKTNAYLDHDERSIYRLTVAATDGGMPAKQTVRTLRIKVLDLNDNTPTFTSSSLVFEVREDVKIGHVVGSVVTSYSSNEENAILGSSSGQITYTLNSSISDVVPDAFDIDRSTGSLVVARKLDRELQPEYRLEVTALDTSAMNNPQSSAVTVRVDILDVNDNFPVWSQDPIEIQVDEDVMVGVSVFNFTANDADSGSNGNLKYKLLKQFPEDGCFQIDPLTGNLLVKKSLDYESLKQYTLIVQATDQCLNVSERLSTAVTAIVSVRDVNDNAPKFVLPSNSKIYFSSSLGIGMPVGQILATDLDDDENGKVTYMISNGNEHGSFTMGYETGIITLAKPLSTVKIFQINVTAMDHGIPSKYVHETFKLAVQDTLESPPRFLSPTYSARVSEDVTVGTYVTKVSAQSMSNGREGNLTFHIPIGVTDDTFAIDKFSGVVNLKKALDRETEEFYSIPIYAFDASRGNHYDMATLRVSVDDVNDHSPEFTMKSCYRLVVPENGNPAVIHTVVASDADKGSNGLISYSITSGNVGNKFNINPSSGELSAKSLDRESHARYHLTIIAQDKGRPQLQGVCNITVYVEDLNDNDPKFDSMLYTANINEDVPVDTSVLKVKATDADNGFNAKIIYSLANESQWLFRIDNKTGIITTAGLFDRETKAEYNFQVVATDSGKYNARSQNVTVKIVIEDVNDNKPIFTQYPFKEKVPAYIQPGQSLLRVSAKDLDIGTNSEIVYSLNDEYGKFKINPNTGILSATQSLASENGKILNLNVIATDKGNPPQSSNGLIEITVGDIPENFPKLKFQNETYDVVLTENTEQFRDVLQVSAVRSDGRRQKIVYFFGTGNEENIFVVNAENGILQVRDPKYLDYELHKEIHLVIGARTEGNPNLRGYCNVNIRLLDQNDNAPKFTQQQYTASVFEGDSKGAFVLETKAYDADEAQNSKVLYHIVDGNHDNTFKFEPAFSGRLVTNIVLDREIRETYRLTVIATDEGVPQMTGTARIRINVIDINDNQPTFPPHSIITITEATEVGTVLTTVTANDVDTNPALTYDFASETDNEVLQTFSIDRFSGKVILTRHLDYELRQEYRLMIMASDMAHEAKTTLTIKVTDVNDNKPMFAQVAYEVTIPSGNSNNIIDLLALNATDDDTGDNANIKYSLINPVHGFSIGALDGILKVNQSNVSTADNLYISVKAEDQGKPRLHSIAVVRIKFSGSSSSQSGDYKKDYSLELFENATLGSNLLQLVDDKLVYYIVEGNEDGNFDISYGNLVLLKKLDRETRDKYLLKLLAGTESVGITLTILDVNDNIPVFEEGNYEVEVKEDQDINSVVGKVSAIDRDEGENGHVTYEITSGNDEGLFGINSGNIIIEGGLDYDIGLTEYTLVIQACDGGQLCALTTFIVKLIDCNDNGPNFPVTEYLEFVGENEPIGSTIFTAHAIDLDRGIFGTLNYSIVGVSNSIYVDDAWKLFSIDASTGLVRTNAVFDYEVRNRYIFVIKASDAGDKFSNVKVRIEIESRDEFSPQFTERLYKFFISSTKYLSAGHVIGRVTATDRDKGPDGRVVYQLSTQHTYLKINRTTGDIVVKKKIETAILGEKISLTITASSGRPKSLTNSSSVEISVNSANDFTMNSAINKSTNSGITDWALGLLIGVILLILTFGAIFVFLHMKNKRNRQVNKPNLSQETVTTNNYVDPSAFDTIPIRSNAAAQFAPPKYDEIPPYGAAASSNSGAATTSELSGSEQSGSSGRGSAEDGDDNDDEEIRMINEGPLQRDSGIHRQNDDDDNLSDVSVRNTQEYLARLGIVNNAAVPQTSRLNQVPLDSLIFDEETATDNDIVNFYAKLNDVANSDRASSTDDAVGVTMDHVMTLGTYEVPQTHQPSMNGSLSSIVHSEEELAGSYNWDYLLDWGPQYQPLAHVFSEIARLKDDTVSVQSGASGSSAKSKNSQVKNVPPPLITSVAPRSIPVLNARGGSNHHLNQMNVLPRSPISHDANSAYHGSAAMSPSFSPSLSPLATKSPSISPLVTPGLTTAHHVRAPQRNKNIDSEMRI
ncbi:PREDICTED: protein dachsous [Nicrophorus vespilloides]|uniref:Protein dachsous n=1 Tax=Nicrophorus vespilloides TaxID=110193 RepID=A0ABM1MEH4_NICVS|nr:PREDICTED: protein dachsous [Nicrophorus vespilloides]